MWSSLAPKIPTTAAEAHSNHSQPLCKSETQVWELLRQNRWRNIHHPTTLQLGPGRRHFLVNQISMLHAKQRCLHIPERLLQPLFADLRKVNTYLQALPWSYALWWWSWNQCINVIYMLRSCGRCPAPCFCFFQKSYPQGPQGSIDDTWRFRTVRGKPIQSPNTNERTWC